MPFFLGLLYVNTYVFDVSSCFDMLLVVLLLLAFISICLWNRLLYYLSYTFDVVAKIL